MSILLRRAALLSVTPTPVDVETVTPGRLDAYDWSEVTRRVQASLERDRRARARRNTQRLLLLMAA